MSQYIQNVKSVAVPSGGAGYRVVDNPYNVPVKNLTILIRSTSVDVTKLTTEVFFGGVISSAGVHSGGVSQGAAAAIGTGTEAAHVVFTHTGIIPSNTQNELGLSGFPIAIELKNTDTAAANIQLIFVAETLGTFV